MSLTINGKIFMNLQEAVAWLLANNALPFQCKVSYVADTEIAKSNIINPSPSEIKIGSLVLFADSKVGTVSGITASGFMVGQEYTDIGSQLNQITDIDLNASQHLIITMENGDTHDAGLVKEISSFSINASQHLIANYNNGTTQDLGAIFQGNVNISGNLTADSIIENMSGYSVTIPANADYTVEKVYYGAVKNGNKLTFVFAANVTKTNPDAGSATVTLADVTIPSAIGAKLYPTTVGAYDFLDNKSISAFETAWSKQDGVAFAQKSSNSSISAKINITTLTVNTKYYVRYEVTFLLSDGL